MRFRINSDSLFDSACVAPWKTTIFFLSVCRSLSAHLNWFDSNWPWLFIGMATLSLSIDKRKMCQSIVIILFWFYFLRNWQHWTERNKTEIASPRIDKFFWLNSLRLFSLLLSYLLLLTFLSLSLSVFFSAVISFIHFHCLFDWFVHFFCCLNSFFSLSFKFCYPSKASEAILRRNVSFVCCCCCRVNKVWIKLKRRNKQTKKCLVVWPGVWTRSGIAATNWRIGWCATTSTWWKRWSWTWSAVTTNKVFV